MTADFERFDRYIFYIFSLKTAHIGFGHVVSIFLHIYIYIVEPTRNDDIKSKIWPCQNTESVSILYTSELLQNGLPIHPHTYTYNFKRLRHKRRASYFSIFCVNNTANITDTQKDMDTNDAMEEATTTTTSSSIS